MALREDDLEELSGGWLAFFGSIYVLATIRDTIAFLLILGVAIACLVVGSTLGRVIGAMLLLAWLAFTVRFIWRHRRVTADGSGTRA